MQVSILRPVQAVATTYINQQRGSNTATSDEILASIQALASMACLPITSLTCGPTASKEAAGGCSHAPRKARNNRTYNLQRSRRWLPTHLRNPRQPDLQLARYVNTEHPDQQLASKPRVAAHTRVGRSCSCDHSNIRLVSSITATEYLWGLPPGHTAASIRF